MPAPDDAPQTNAPAPKKRATPTPVRTLAEHAVEAILDKKGQDIVVLDVRGVSGAADVFVIATSESDLQAKAITQGIRTEIKEAVGERAWHVEGNDHWQWVLLDYVDLVVHIFDREKREHYDLERLWGDAPSQQVAGDASGVTLEFLDAPARAPQPDDAERTTDSATPPGGRRVDEDSDGDDVSSDASTSAA